MDTDPVWLGIRKGLPPGIDFFSEMGYKRASSVHSG